MKYSTLKPVVIAVVGAFSLGRIAAAGEDVLDTQYAKYFADEVTCEGDAGSNSFEGSWNGRHWKVVAPAAVDTTKAWERKYGVGLHIKPLNAFREGMASLGGLTPDPGGTVSSNTVTNGGEVR